MSDYTTLDEFIRSGLEAENAKLKADNEEMNKLYEEGLSEYVLAQINKDLRADNEKLRRQRNEARTMLAGIRHNIGEMLRGQSE